MSASRVEGDITYRGSIEFKTAPIVPAASFGGTEMKITDPIPVNKLQHQYIAHYFKAGTAAAETVPLHCAYGDGTVLAVNVGSIVACTSTGTITIDVKKNGTTILSSTKTLNSSNTARVAVAATLSGTPTYVSGDLFEVVVTTSGSVVGTGLFVNMVVKEDAEP